MSPILGIYASQISGHRFAPSGAYDSIATTTVGAGGASSITFSSIPQTYTHLQIRYISRSNRADITDWLQLTFNSDTGSNYTQHFLRGNGSAASAGATTPATYINAGTSVAQTGGSDIFGATVVDVLDYKDTNKYKTVRSLNGHDRNGAGFVYFESGVWMNTNAITTLTLTGGAAAFSQYSSFALYGIRGN